MAEMLPAGARDHQRPHGADDGAARID